jgi:esterase/lipase superfamily enzyme
MPTDVKNAKSALLREIADLEGDLVDAVYLIECFRTDYEELRGSGKVFEITSFYATNRKPTGRVAPADFYGIEHADVQYGRVTITIPSHHTVGVIELPTLWRLEISSDPSIHFTIRELKPLQEANALDEMRAAAGNAQSRALLLFVHGFNISFVEAALRTAQLTHDLRFPGVSMFMSWPASKQYPRDEESVEIAENVLNGLLDKLGSLPFDSIYILAHSMGNRLLTRVLAARKHRGHDLSKIRDIMLAAPDINAEVFKANIAPVLGGLSGMRKTIYASSNDVALKFSKKIHDFRRVGETADGVLTYAGFDMIDATKAAPIRRAWGHSYVFDSRPVLADLEDLLVGRKDAVRRQLKRTGSSPNQYWVLE